MMDDTDAVPKLNTNNTKISSSILDAFDELKVPKDDSKLIGGAKIISFLQNNESEKDVNYVLKRLVRSLGANVPDQRSGYFATLIALLSKNEHIAVTHVLDLVKKELHASGGSKSEVGDVSLGQILVCGAIFRSGLMLRSSEDEQKQVIQLLLNASQKKSYLGTVAYHLLLDFVNGLDALQFASIVWKNIKPEFKKDIKEHSLDSLYFLLMVSKKFPEKVKLQKLMGFSEILCEDNIQTICDKIMAGIDFNTIGHPIFNEIAKLVAPSPHLLLFWTTIDSQLVKHNRNRELVAINLLTTILSNIEDNAQLIPELISKNFFKLFMDWFKGLQTASKIRNKNDNEDDNKLMIKKQKELLNTLCKALKSAKCEMKTKLEVLKKLLFNPGDMNFTETTGTSIVKTIIADLDKNGVKKMAKLLKGVLLNTSKKLIKQDVERNWFNNERVKAAELLSYLVSHETVKDDTDFKLIYMKILMCFGFFKIGGDENIVISNELSGSIKNCFYRCFSSRFSNVDSLVVVLSSLSNFMTSNLAIEAVRIKLEKQISKENVECWEMLTEVCQNIEKNGSKSKIDKVFLILLYQLGLFLFSEPTHVKMARSSIKELKSCYEHYRKGKKKKPKKIKEGELDDGDPEWIEVMVEVLLSILSTESSVLRSVVQCVFRLLWEYLTPSSIGQIISVLDPDSDSNPLSQDSDSEDDSGNEKTENGEAGEESSCESDDSDSEIEEEDEMKAPDQLRIAVQKALGTAAPDTDTESIDADMIDEEEGKKLDEALAEAFRQYQEGKGKKNKKDRKNRKSLSDFRIRVLDLIDIYLEKDPSMDICLGMIAPLTRCLEFCIQDSQYSELENRVRKTIKNLTKIKKFSSLDDVNTEILCDYLKSIIEKGNRSQFIFQALGDVITHFGTFVIHCSQKVNANKPIVTKKNKSTSSLLEILEEALKSYFHNRNCLLPIIFFHNILQAEWEGAYTLISAIIENIFDKDVRQFRRNEGIELMAGFYRALKRNKPSNDNLLRELSYIEDKLENMVTQVLGKENGDFAVKKNFLVSLKKLLNTIKMFHESCHIKSNLKYENLLQIVSSYKAVKINSQKQENQSNSENRKVKPNKKKPTKKKLKRKLDKINGHSDESQKRPRTNSVSQ